MSVGVFGVPFQNYAVSSSSGNYSYSSSTFATVNNLSIANFQATGKRFVEIFLTSDGGGAGSPTEIKFTATQMQLIFRRSTTEIYRYNSSAAVAQGWPASAFRHLDRPSAGSYTYDVQVNAQSGTINMTNVVLYVIEWP